MSIEIFTDNAGACGPALSVRLLLYSRTALT